MKYDTKPEIDLKELFLIIWNKKIFLFLFTIIFSLSSVFYALSLPNIYTSVSVLSSTSSDDSLGGQFQDYSTLAGIAGISIPSSNDNKTYEAIERIKSFDFFEEQFLPYIDLKNLVASKNWDQIGNKIIYDKKIFDEKSNKWVRDFKFPRGLIPSNQEAYEEYKKIIDISKDKSTSFITIKVNHVSPFVAQKWAKLIINNINDHMRELDKTVARDSINFLNSSSEKIQLFELKEVISSLLEGQMRVLTLAEANQHYVLKPISSPMAPEIKSGPSRSIICIIGSIVGFIFGIIIILTFHYYKFTKEES